MKILSTVGIFVLAILCSIRAQAQDLPSIIPPPPNAAAFTQYSDVPVGLYTGVPNVNIPLYTVKSGEITLPISLSYHASGIKVAQEASWVGLGWVLNNGGMITREIRGIDDFTSNNIYGGYPTDSDLYTEEIIADFYDGSYDQQEFEEYINHIKEYGDGTKDPEADIFHYNFLGYSGKMLIEKQTGTPLKATPLKQNNMLFFYDGNEWVITDENGWKYFFGTQELTDTYSGGYTLLSYPNDSWLPPSTGESHVSAWYLDKILTPNGDEITFVYENNMHRTRTQVQITESYWHDNFNDQAIGNADHNRFSGSMQQTNDVYLEKIQFKNGYINFVTENRLDMDTAGPLLPQRLNYFEVFDNHNNPIDKIDFQYTYFNEQTNDSEFMRLKLDAIQKSNQQTSQPPHEFAYNQIDLPSKKSLSIDYWGYYNNANNDNVKVQIIEPIEIADLTPGGTGVNAVGASNQNFVKTSIPEMQIPIKNATEIVTITGANRNPSTYYMQAGILQSIKYPTGAITNFKYEPHDYYDPTTPYYKEIGNIKKEVWRGPLGQPLPGVGNQQETLTFTEETLVTVDFYFEYLPAGTIDLNGVNIVIEDNTGNTLVKFIPDIQGGNTQILTLLINFPAGDYVMKIENLNRENYIIGIIANYKEFVVDTKKTGGGIRIAEIETVDLTQTSKKKVYEYSDNGISNGRLMLLWRHWTKVKYHFETTNTSNLVKEYCVRSSSNYIANNLSNQGGNVGYNYVKVADVSPGGVKLGETISHFENGIRPVVPIFQTIVPGVPYSYPSINGELKIVETFNDSGVLLHKKEINYDEEIILIGNRPTNLIPSMKLFSQKPPPLIVGSYNFTDVVHIHEIYYTASQWRYPVSEIETAYDLNGNNPVLTAKSFFYNSTSHKNITRTETKNSKGETIVSNMEYPSDYPSGTGMSTSTFDAMVADNMINPIIKQTTTINGELLSTQITTYKDWDVDGDNVTNDPDDILLPELIKSAKGTITTSNPLQDKIEFVKYDEQGRVLEVKQPDGTPISYVWGYNNEYPIAKIENATYSQVSSQVSNLQSKTNLDNDHCLDSGSCDEKNLRTALANLRVSLPNAMVSTYTYNPLVGITSMTDPKGYTVYYEYDELNRLKLVKNANGDIVSQNEYHYKGQ